MRNQRLIGGGHLVIPEQVRPNPGEPLAFLRGGESLPAPADIERHQKMEVFVSVACEGQRRQARLPHDNAKLLLQLADQRLFGTLAGLDLASGKLLYARHRLAGRTLGEQHAAVGIDQGAGGNQNEFDAHGPCLEPSAWLSGLQSLPNKL